MTEGRNIFTSFRYDIGGKCEGRLKVQYNLFVSGKEESNLSDAGDYLDTSNDQKSGSGLDFSYAPNSGEFQVYFRY